MKKLTFRKTELEDFEFIYKYTSRFGEGSCQHSFVSMYSMYEKYGDVICEEDHTLYVLRSNLCDQDYRVFLAPMGSGDRKATFQRILDDTAGQGKKVKFITLTERNALFLEEAFPGRFHISEEADLGEYIYRADKMATFSGRRLKKRRSEVNHFHTLYGSRASVKRITPADFDDLLAFEEWWTRTSMEDHDEKSLNREKRMIGFQLDHFDRLRLSGILVRIDGKVKGFGYGTKLSPSFYDAIIEKGDRSVPHIYRVLRSESVRQCAMDCTYVNMEEDLGIPGLRAVKHLYKPDFIIKKYIAVEK